MRVVAVLCRDVWLSLRFSLTLDFLPILTQGQMQFSLLLQDVHGRMTKCYPLFFSQRAQMQILDAICRCQSPPPRRQTHYS